jgi:glycine cleavage system H lipoate-binding protein
MTDTTKLELTIQTSELEHLTAIAAQHNLTIHEFISQCLSLGLTTLAQKDLGNDIIFVDLSKAQGRFEFSQPNETIWNKS